MAIRIKNEKASDSLLSRVEEISGAELNACFQCRKCTSGCPVSGMVDSQPSQVLRMLHLGVGNELLETDLIWTCASCETCSARCPMGVDVAAVMDALRRLAVEEGAESASGTVRAFNRAFLKSVKSRGRIYDLAMITWYKLKTFTFMQDTDKFPKMLRKRKIALLPPSGADKATVKRVFKKVKQASGDTK